MARSQDSDSKQLNLYDKYEKPAVQYEVVKVPLQNQVSTVRKSLSQAWSQIRGTLISSVSSVRVKTRDGLMSLGVKNPTRVMQASAVGTATLMGFYLVRKRSLFSRIFFPILAGGTTAWVIHISNPKNRDQIYTKIKTEFSENFEREFSKKNFPKEFSKRFPKGLQEKMKDQSSKKLDETLKPQSSESDSKEDT